MARSRPAPRATGCRRCAGRSRGRPLPRSDARLLVADEGGVLTDFARTALQLGFVEGRDLSLVDEVLEAAARVGLDPPNVRERITAPEIKQRLIAEAAAAHARGVFGVPTLDTGDELLWGDNKI